MSEINAGDDSQEIAKSIPPFGNNPVGADWKTVLPEMQPPGQPGGDPVGSSQACHDQPPDQILLMQELERQRIAMDLHDGLGPLITLIKLELQNVSKCIGESRPDLALARAAIRRAEENVARTFDELRRTVLDLRPAMLDDLGILHALGWLIRQFELSGTDAIIQSRLLAAEGAVPVSLKIVIFRICQEALNNVIKHALASHVRVTLEICGDDLHLSIEDDGGGIASGTGELFNRSGGGLPGILRRATSSNGSCSVDSAGGRGTRITIRWPLTPRLDGSRAEPSGSDDPLASIISH